MKTSITNLSFTRADRNLLQEGIWYDAYRKLGAHPGTFKKQTGVFFSVWAPHAKKVSLLTATYGWEESPFPMKRRQGGVWELFLPGCSVGEKYLFSVTGADGVERRKADPFAFSAELRPGRASVVADLSTYFWQDGKYLSSRRTRDIHRSPFAVYEVHLGSWKRNPNPDSQVSLLPMSGPWATRMWN